MVSLISKKYQKDIAFLMFMVLSLNFTAPLYGSGVTGLFDFPGGAEESSNLLPVIYVASAESGNERMNGHAEAAMEASEPLKEAGASLTDSIEATEVIEDFDTDGPSQPEMRGFTPVGASDMVDLFTGDFSYNIPLLDVGGYPVNISYNGNVTMDQESSWVGLGWNINPGAISRNPRGIPDDFNGGDKIIKTNRMKPHTVVGGSLGASLEVSGLPMNLGLGLGAFYNSKTGWGTELSVSPSINLAGQTKADKNSAQTSSPDTTRTKFNLGVKLSLNSQEGLGFSPTAGYSLESMNKGDLGHVSVGTNYNSRAGLTSLTVTGSAPFKYRHQGQDAYSPFSSSVSVDFLKRVGIPTISMPMTSENYNFYVGIGADVTVLHAPINVAGYYSRSEIKLKDQTRSMSAYGYMHFGTGQKDNKALLDLNREKEMPYREKPVAQNIAIPSYTYDVFSVTGEGTGGAFRLYRSDVGHMFDHEIYSKSISVGGGVDIGGGGPPASGKWGGNISLAHTVNSNTKWDNGNIAANNFKFLESEQGSLKEPVYFKNAGEAGVSKQKLFTKFGDDQLVKLKTRTLSGVLVPNFILENKLDIYNDAAQRTGNIAISSNMSNSTQRERRNQLMTYTTASEAVLSGDRYIPSYNVNYFFTNCAPNANNVQYIPRNDGEVRKGHHLSNISVLNADGKRYEYNIPVYNIENREVTYSVKRYPLLDTEKNTVTTRARTGTLLIGEKASQRKISDYDIHDADQDRATDQYYMRQITPAYSHSFLLTGIFSPDYVDATGDGPSEDDMGDAVSFKYSQVYSKQNPYRWRSPVNLIDTALGGFDIEGKQWITKKQLNGNYEEGLKTDFRDDKASYVYGEKEVWYLNSIESKTMIATFEVSLRSDAANQNSELGGLNGSQQLYQLDAIKLYSKSDFARFGINAKPIKAVHLEYDYSLCTNYPLNTNNLTAGGKLTLKKIWFSYNGNEKSKKNAYRFSYRNNQPYQYQAADNWGNYKDPSDNYGTGTVKLTNKDYPYPVPDRLKAGKEANVAPWALDSIILPSGSNIKVSYEADDYGYVQNKRALQLFRIYGLGRTSNLSSADNRLYESKDDAKDHRYVFVKVPFKVNTKAELYDRYLKELNYIYFRLNVRMPDDRLFDIYRKNYEFVKLYAKLKKDSYGIADAVNNIIWFEVQGTSRKGNKDEGYSPLAKATIQFLRTDLPMKAYPGSAFPADEPLKIGAFASALVGSFKEIANVIAGYHGAMKNREVCKTIDLSTSFVRLATPGYNKTGGGYRVKRVEIRDNWNKMTGQSQAVYGQEYFYTKEVSMGTKKEMISSGVATFEPFLGGEENPFKFPIEEYDEQSGLLGPANSFYTEGPLMESFYPGASVGYSNVRVRSIHHTGVKSKTGWSETKFFTAYDYPVIEKHTPLTDGLLRFKTPVRFNPLKIITEEKTTLSQGFKIELNDMHGKVHMQLTYSESDTKMPLSKTVYYYQSDKLDLNSYKLNNDVLTIDKTGAVSRNQLGRDIELMADFRQQKSKLSTGGLNGNISMFAAGFIPVIIAMILKVPQFSTTTYQAAALSKVVNRRAVLQKVEVYDKGSMVSTENLAYDEETGEVLVTRTNNEYDDPVYNVNIPAHWAYDRMGPAYKNTGVTVTDCIIKGRLQNSANEQFFVPGDEVLCITPRYSQRQDYAVKLWVVKASEAISTTGYLDPVTNIPGYGPSYNDLRFVTRDGNLFTTPQVSGIGTGVNSSMKIIRSGRRNQMGAGIGSYTLKTNPIIGGQLKLDIANSVLNAGAIAFKEDWATQNRYWQIDTCNKLCLCPEGYILNPETNDCVKFIDNYPIVSQYPPSYLGAKRSAQYSLYGLRFFKHNEAVLDNTTILADYNYVNYTNNNAYWKNISPADTVKGVLNRVGLWVVNVKNDSDEDRPVGKDSTIGFIKTFYIPKNKEYFIGISADNYFQIKINCKPFLANETTDQRNFNWWNIYKVRLDSGWNTIQMTGSNGGLIASFGTEIYDNTESEIVHATADSDLKILFSSRIMRGGQVHYGAGYGSYCPNGGCLQEYNGVLYCMASDSTSVVPAKCYNQQPENDGLAPVNPYTLGLLGNYRPWRSYQYYAGRKEQGFGHNDSSDIRTYGTLNNYTPFWNFNPSNNRLEATDLQTHPEWVWSSQNTLYNRRGMGIETKDPLGRFTMGQYGYHGTVPVAVAQNSRYRESAFESFEDYGFDMSSCQSVTDSCARRVLKHFDWSRFKSKIQQLIVHTGKHALKLNESETAGLSFDITNQSSDHLPLWLRLRSGTEPEGMLTDESSRLPVFSPGYGDKIVLSIWVRENGDCHPGDDYRNKVSVTFKTSANQVVNSPVPANISVSTAIEGWQRLAFEITVPEVSSNASKMFINLSGNGRVSYFDDLRIHPYHANMKSFVYDPVSLRLMAELDENNYASFYEYDDEGTLIRVKKETERGIKTIKETRSALLKEDE